MEVGDRGAQWLRCRATNRKVAGLVPDGVFFIDIILFFVNIFISQHAPLLMSNTTCIVLNFTYYDLSCLYTFYNIY